MPRWQRTLVIFLGLSALLAGAYSGWWMFLASGLRDKTQTWIAERRELGHEIIYGGLEVEGFPFALRLALREVSYVLNPGGEGWAWHGEDMSVTLRPWDPSHLEFSIHGTHRLTYAVAGGGWHTATLRAGAVAGMVGLDGAGLPWAGFLDTEGLEITSREDAPPIMLRHFHFDLRRLLPSEAVVENSEAAMVGSEAAGLPAFLVPAHEAPLLQAAFILKGLRLPDAAVLPFGPEVELVQGRINLLGTPLEGTPRHAAEAWRDGGGTVELVELVLRWDGLDISGGGTLALDGELQPTGAMTLSVQGFGTVIDILVARGVIRPGPAATARIILGLMERTPKEGRAPVLKVPFSIQNRKLFVGPVRLAELPAIVWE